MFVAQLQSYGHSAILASELNRDLWTCGSIQQLGEKATKKIMSNLVVEPSGETQNLNGY